MATEAPTEANKVISTILRTSAIGDTYYARDGGAPALFRAEFHGQGAVRLLHERPTAAYRFPPPGAHQKRLEGR